MCFLSRKKVQTEKVCNSPGAQNQSLRDWSMLSNADVKCVACMCAYDVRAIFFKFAICSLYFSYSKKTYIRINKNSHILPSRYYLFLCRKKSVHCSLVLKNKFEGKSNQNEWIEAKNSLVHVMLMKWTHRKSKATWPVHQVYEKLHCILHWAHMQQHIF